MGTPKFVSPDKAKPELPSPAKWWQWLLVYPTLLLAFLGSVPTFVELYKSRALGVPFGSSRDAEEQNGLWSANVECLKDAQFISIVNRFNVEIGSNVCKTGDVLLRSKRPEMESVSYRWVAWSRVAPTTQAEFSLIGSAYAGTVAGTVGGSVAGTLPPAFTVPGQQPKVLCHRWIGNGLLLSRLSTPNGCIDEVVNTYSGWVVRRNPAPCNPDC